jgi:F-type H+-transporting ATPase subunit b
MSRPPAHGPRHTTAGHPPDRPAPSIGARASAGARLALAAAATAWLAAAWPASALAAEESHGRPWLDLLWKAVNLAVLVGVIVYFGRKPIAAALRALAKETHDRWNKAHQAAQATQADLAAQRKQLEGLEGEMKRMAADASADAEREHARIVQEARQQAERIMTLARGQVEQEMAKARTELRHQLAEETLRLAQQMIEQQSTSDQRKRLMEAYLHEMESRR